MAKDTDTIERIFSEARQRVGAIVAQGDREDIDGILDAAQERAARVVAEVSPWEGLDFDALGEWGGDLEALAGWDIDLKAPEWDFEPLAGWDIDLKTWEWGKKETAREAADLEALEKEDLKADLEALNFDAPDGCPFCGRPLNTTLNTSPTTEHHDTEQSAHPGTAGVSGNGNP